MAQPVTVENEVFRLEVWPQFGGKISSVVDKADNFELLFNFPTELPTRPQYDIPYVKSWYAGWDECFPAVAPSRYVGHPYDGIAVPDHGELWGLPTMNVPAKGGITTVWNGLRFGYRLTRKVILDGNGLTADYSLINLAPFQFQFIWAQQALLAMNTKVELSMDDTPLRYSNDAAGAERQETFDWGNARGELESVHHPSAMPPGRAWKIYATNPIASPVTIRYPLRGQGRTLRMEYASDTGLPAFWGLWVNTGGWAGHRHLSIQPTTGRYDQLERCIADHSAGTIAPSGRHDWMVKWTVS